MKVSQDLLPTDISLSHASCLFPDGDTWSAETQSRGQRQRWRVCYYKQRGQAYCKSDLLARGAGECDRNADDKSSQPSWGNILKY